MVRARLKYLTFAALLLGPLGCGPRSEVPGIDSANAQRSKANDAISTARKTAIVEAVNRVRLSVVSISVLSRRQASRPDLDDWFFFVPRTPQQTFCTGFVLKPGGIIVTNQHCVAHADSITVSLSDGSDLAAQLLGQDPTIDVAVLKVDRNLPPVTIGDSRDLMTGEWVIALGNPYIYLLGNSDPTVTAGVVSATGRNVVPNSAQSGLYLDMIQTDAAINPGNSGGPLTNALGDVVGVNSFIFSSSGGSIGLGFAIPIERVKRVAEEIIKNGHVRRAWVGFEPDNAPNLDWKRAGVTISDIAKNGPADKAGLEVGMVLQQVLRPVNDKRQLRNYLDWEAVKLDLRAGDTIVVRAAKRDSTSTYKLVASDIPSLAAPKVSIIPGLEVITLTPEIAWEQQVRSKRGAMIYRISDPVAALTQLRAGDVIRTVRTRTVLNITTAEQLKKTLGAIKTGQRFRIQYERQGRIDYIELAFQ